MTSIQDTVTISYHNLSTIDVITMIPVMDSLARDLKYYNKQIRKLREEKKDYEAKEYKASIAEYSNKANNTFAQLNILKQIGLYTTNGNRDIEIPEEIII